MFSLEIQEHNHGIQDDAGKKTSGNGGKVKKGEEKLTKIDKVLVLQKADTVQSIIDHLEIIKTKRPFRMNNIKNMNDERKKVFNNIKLEEKSNLYVSSFGYLCKYGEQSGPIEREKKQTDPYNSFLFQLETFLDIKIQNYRIDDPFYYVKNEIQFDKEVSNMINLDQFFVFSGSNKLPLGNNFVSDISRIKTCHRGFIDLGSFSNINPVVQFILSFDQLIGFVHKHDFSFDGKNYPFLDAFSKIVQIYSNPNCNFGCYSAKIFRDLLKNIFKNDQNHSPKEIFCEILGNLSSEIHSFCEKNPSLFSKYSPQYTSRMIEELFGAKLKKSIRCVICNHTLDSEILEKIHSLPKSDEKIIQPFLDFLFKEQSILSHCTLCKKETPKQINFSVLSLPPLLILHLEGNPTLNNLSQNISLGDSTRNHTLYSLVSTINFDKSNFFFFSKFK
jgi:hypothetical protein